MLAQLQADRSMNIFGHCSSPTEHGAAILSQLRRFPPAHGKKRRYGFPIRENREIRGIFMTTSIYDIPVRKIDGTPASLAEFKNSVVLIVNVASKCGLTKQYDGLEKLYEKYRDRGLVVAGFPANDFAQQEPGGNDEIQEFCRANFGVKFPLFEKITVVGDHKHPLYRAL